MHVQTEEFRQFAGMGEAHFLRGVAGKHGVQIEDIDKLKEIYYGIYLAKVAESNENIGLPGLQPPSMLIFEFTSAQLSLHGIKQAGR